MIYTLNKFYKSISCLSFHPASIAQWLACLTSNLKVRGSNLLLNQFFQKIELRKISSTLKNWFRRSLEPLTIQILVKHALVQ